jgi:FMN phosphatase YigB (HAD superfamily)
MEVNVTIRAIFFDVFGTLLDMSSLQATDEGRAELRAYGEHLAEFQRTGVYKPLVLPGRWKDLPVFNDVDAGLIGLLEDGYKVYTFSNGPVELTNTALWKPGMPIDEISAIDVREARGFKPTKWMYLWACGRAGHAPSECLMVTANEHFGDLEGARACGMQAQLIRGEECPDLIALAERLGC